MSAVGVAGSSLPSTTSVGVLALGRVGCQIGINQGLAGGAVRRGIGRQQHGAAFDRLRMLHERHA
jgi:hypothetical protein